MPAFSVGEAFDYAKRSAAQNRKFFAVAALTVVAVSFVPSFVADMIEKNSPITSFALGMTGSIISIIVALGVVRLALDFLDEGATSYDPLFSQTHLFFRYLGTSILAGLATFAGLFLLIVPGIIIGIRLSLFSYLLVDRNLGVLDSLRESARITKGSVGSLFVLGLICSLLNLAGLLAFGIGLLFTMPISWLAFAYAYRKLSAATPEAATQ